MHLKLSGGNIAGRRVRVSGICYKMIFPIHEEGITVGDRARFVTSSSLWNIILHKKDHVTI